MSDSQTLPLYIVTEVGKEMQSWVVRGVLFIPKLFFAGILLFIFYLIASAASNTVKKLLSRFKAEKTISQIICLIIYWIIFALGITLSLNVLGLKGLVASIVAGAGFTSVVVAFGTQDISKNVLAGMMIIASRQFMVGDNIIVTGGYEGVVRKITLRAVVIEASDGRIISVPSNVIFSNVTVNLTAMGRRKATIEVKVKPETELNELSTKILKILDRELSIFKKPTPEILLTEIGKKYKTIQINYWADSSPMMQRKSISEVNALLHKMFEKEGIYAEL